VNTVWLDKKALGERLLSSDVMCNYIPQTQWPELIDFAWDKGKQQAAKYRGQKPSDLALEKDITIVEHDKGPRQIYSEFYANRKRLILNKNCIEDNFIKKNRKYLPDDSYEAVRELFIAHELFHYLECCDPAVGITFRQRKVVARRVFGKEWKVGIRALSEIGAHSFSKHLLDWPAL